MLALAGKLLWAAMAAAWYLIRLPHELKARRTGIETSGRDAAERIRMIIAGIGLGVLPLVHFWTPLLNFAGDAPSLSRLLLGVAAATAALALFFLTHQALGRFWSVSLDIRQDHRLVTEGVYGVLRHPMYCAFWLMALAQALFLANWIAGPAELLGFGFLFFSRIGPEEKLMRARFGAAYDEYCQHSWRIVPHVW